MDDDDAKRVLLEIRRIVLRSYPFQEGDTVDPRYAMAFGLIAGAADEAIRAVRENRPIQLGNLGFKETVLAHGAAVERKDAG